MSSRGVWHLYSTRAAGVVTPEPVRRLPKGAEVSADGTWAELADEKGVVKVFVRLNGKVELPARRKVA